MKKRSWLASRRCRGWMAQNNRVVVLLIAFPSTSHFSGNVRSNLALALLVAVKILLVGDLLSVGWGEGP